MHNDSYYNYLNTERKRKKLSYLISLFQLFSSSIFLILFYLNFKTFIHLYLVIIVETWKLKPSKGTFEVKDFCNITLVWDNNMTIQQKKKKN